MIKNYLFCLWITGVIVAASMTNVYAYGDTFSCSFGKQAACLGYGDKVCSSRAKCVSNDAICFDSYACGYDGFVCKSKLDELADEYDGLLSKYRNVASEHDDLVDDYNDLLRKYKNLATEYEDKQSCIDYSSTLDGAKNCY